MSILTVITYLYLGIAQLATSSDNSFCNTFYP